MPSPETPTTPTERGVKILGIDLSLTATGFANDDEPPLRAWTFKANGDGLHRLRSLRAECVSWARNADLVVIEGPSYGSKFGKAHERAGLWWLVYDRLERDGTRIAVVPPSNLKQYATGKGNATKEAVLVAAAKRFPSFEGDNNAADAAWLLAMGADHLGQPITVLPQTHRNALIGVEWPALIGANS